MPGRRLIIFFIRIVVRKVTFRTLALLKDTWLSTPSKEQNKKHVFNYVIELRDKIDKAIDITDKETTIARQTSRKWFDKTP